MSEIFSTEFRWWFPSAPWYLWLPSFAMAGYNIVLLYRLDAPHSAGTRVARTFGVMACILCLFSPFHLYLIAGAYLLVFASFTAQNTQFLREEKRRRRREAKTDSLPEKIVAAVVQPHQNGATQ